MTKRELISMVIKRLGEDGRLGERTVGKYLGVAWQQIIKDVFGKTPQKLNFYTKSYKGIQVQFDEDTQDYYALLPVQTIQDISAEEGVRRIRTQSHESLDFVPLDINPAYLGNTDVGLVLDVVGYRVYEDRVVFYHMNEDVENVIMDIIPSFDEIGMDEQVNMPQGQAANIVMVTIQMLTGTPFVDPQQSHKNIEMK